MYIIDWFVEETTPGKSLWTKEMFLSLNNFFSLDQIPNIKFCHMVSKQHPEVTEGRWWLIAVDVPDSEEATEYASIDRDGAATDEYYGSSLVGKSVKEEL